MVTTSGFMQAIKFTAIAILTLALTVVWPSKGLGQIPLFPTSNSDSPEQALPWDLNNAYACGKFWCSNIYLYDDYTQVDASSLLEPELILSASKRSSQTDIEVAQEVQERAKLVQRITNKIVRDVTRKVTKLADIPYQSSWRYWLPTTIKGVHPSTPNIEVGIQNEQTVIYAPAQPELGMAAQTIVTVTEIDAKANGKTIEELTLVWQQSIRESISNSLWGHDFDQQHPLWRWLLSAGIIGTTLGLIWLPYSVRRSVGRWNNRLKQRLNDITNSLTIEPEAVSSQPLNQNVSLIRDSTMPLEGQVGELYESTSKPVKATYHLTHLKAHISTLFKRLNGKHHRASSQSNISEQQCLLDQQTSLKQQRNMAGLLMAYLAIAEILILALGIIVVVLIFRQTRFLSVYLVSQTAFLLTLWITLILIDKISDATIDHLVANWATEVQTENPDSNRYTLRANTYSLTLKRATTFIITVAGFYISIVSLGVNPSILTGAGIFAVAIAFLSRSLIEDMLNGTLILSTDRYAIGDVIDVGGGMAGLVEDINLFVTTLRNLDGESIAIPNSKITAVINKSKYWSRVNFTIKVAYNEDINQAISVMTEVATKMESEPDWTSKFLESAQILGIDEVSNEGILIHLIIKTQPMEQWNVGREFRRRVKEALDAAGISLAIPHHQISVIHPSKDDSSQVISGLPLDHVD